jgi:hypothetical protein
MTDPGANKLAIAGVAESTATADGGRRDIVIDGAQTEAFTSVVTEYDASGALLTQTQFLDNGTVSGTIYDPAGRVLTGGAGAEAFIQTGDRTVMSYLVKPLQDQIMKAFRER